MDFHGHSFSTVSEIESVSKHLFKLKSESENLQRQEKVTHE